ncbi:MAG TPA: hypothetical protein VFY45_01815 [Baekduia sp.]|nr:hypothetical protein [Baekduia sp.]
MIGYQLVRPDDVVRASLNGIFDRLRDHHGDEVVFRGVPDSGGVAMTCFIGAR